LARVPKQVGVSDPLQEKVFKSALVITPPQEMWGPIQALRSKHDKAFERWMPHVNLLYPFVPEAVFPEALDRLNKALAQLPRFTVRLEKLGYFNFGNTCTIWADPVSSPPDAIQRLHAALLHCFPHCTETSDEGVFRPHLTLGQFPGKLATEEMIAKTDWAPIEFTVEGVHLISRSAEDPFTVKFTAALGGDDGVWAPSTAVPSTSTPKSNDPVTVDTAAEDKAVATVERWITKNEKKNLPKTRAKLCKAIAPMLRIEYRVAVGVVLDHLKNQGLVKLCGEKITLSKKLGGGDDDRAVQVAPSGTKFPEILGGVLGRARAWCSRQKVPPAKLEGLTNGLTQLCCVREPINPDTIVDVLLRREVISVDSSADSIVSYKI
jgi:2'-5' RNA ligase